MNSKANRFRLEIVTIERHLFDDYVDMVVVPAVDGVLGVLPNHAPMISLLTYGELVVRIYDKEDFSYAIGGGVIQILSDHVVVLADSAEHEGEIDVQKAEEARERAEKLIHQPTSDLDLAVMRNTLKKSEVRLSVARRRKSNYPPQLDN